MEQLRGHLVSSQGHPIAVSKGAPHSKGIGEQNQLPKGF